MPSEAFRTLQPLDEAPLACVDCSVEIGVTFEVDAVAFDDDETLRFAADALRTESTGSKVESVCLASPAPVLEVWVLGVESMMRAYGTHGSFFL